MALNRSQTASNVLGSLTPDLGVMEANVARGMNGQKPSGWRRANKGLPAFTRRTLPRRGVRKPPPGQVSGNV